METNSILRRLEMYAMVYAIEKDFIENFSVKLSIQDIPKELIVRSQNVSDRNNIEEVLRGLDIQAYIEISNANALKLNITKKEKEFINSGLHNLIPIRNKVMHPRLFGYFDYSVLKACFYMVATELTFMTWRNVGEVTKMINEDPSQLKVFERNLRKSNNVIENLPTTVDFDDTSFIGRTKEIGEIKERLFKRNVHILSILGDGGIGKTAITIKLLYDLLDDEKNPFELILWVSLKTKELNNYEFSNISNAIDNIGSMYEELNSLIGGGGTDIRQNIINISKELKTLLVLDNLETINTEEVRDFLDDFSEYGKVIITSRIGLGEMEHRYFLQGLTDKDLMEYVNTLLELYNKTNYLTEEEKISFAKDELHSNPLAIKWFIRGLADGQKPLDMLRNKDNLVNFCMSNVYEKLTDSAKEILLILKSIRMDITFAELAYLIGRERYDEVEVRGAINELCKCNFLNPEKFQLEEFLSITEFAQEFIKLSVAEDNEKKGFLNNKLKALNAFDQAMLTKRYNHPYALQTFYYDVSERKKSVAAFYLSEAVAAYNKKNIDLAFDLIKMARSLCPKYFECNKIEAYFFRVSNPQRALEEYTIAKKNAQTNMETRLILINFKEFCLSQNDYLGALNAINEAIEIQDEILLQFEKVKILAGIGRFDEAEAVLSSIESESHKDSKHENVFLTRKADLFKRKAEQLRDNKQRIDLLIYACDLIQSAREMMESSLHYLANILSELIHFYYDAKAVEYIYKTLRSVDSKIFKTTAIKELRAKIAIVKEKIPEFEGREEFLNMMIDINAIISTLEDNQGVVYNLRERYGFVKNQVYTGGIYFSLSDIDYDVQIGDIVRLDNIFLTPRGHVVKDMKLIRRS